jgi:diaminopropionate ammonia-lyase
MGDCGFFINPDAEMPEEIIAKYKGKFDNADIGIFHKKLPGYMPTQVYSLETLASELGLGSLYVKDESDRMGLKAFKILGASYAINKILKESEGDVTFCTATDGNHGRAVAWASRLMGKKSVIFLPENTVDARYHSIENEGAVVIEVKGNYDDAVRTAKSQADEKGWVLVQDTAWEGYDEIPQYIMAGYSTILREMENDLNAADMPKYDIVFLKAGVGSWAATAVWYLHERYGENRPKIVVVEPTGAHCCLESMRQGKIATIEGTHETIMAGLNCGTPSTLAMEILREGVDMFISIPDWYAKVAMMALFYSKGDDEQIISGGSGAAGLGGLMALMNEDTLNEARDYIGLNPSSRVLVFNTEGNTDPVNFNKVIHGD